MSWLKPTTFVLLLLPGLWLVYAIVGEYQQPGSQLGGDPAAELVDFLGEWTIRCLLLALAITPLRKFTGINALARIRRMTGLFAFGYLCLHLIAYAVALAGMDVQVLVQDLTERPYIIVGFSAFLLLTPMALTSTRGWQRRLKKRWVTLHKAVFPAVGLGLLHLFWLTKDGYEEVAAYTLVFVLLLASRWYLKRTPQRPKVVTEAS